MREPQARLYERCRAFAFAFFDERSSFGSLLCLRPVDRRLTRDDRSTQEPTKICFFKRQVNGLGNRLVPKQCLAMVLLRRDTNVVRASRSCGES
jgi:hypothetical protein